VVLRVFFLYKSSYELDNLYNDPIKVNQVYDNYTYDEYSDHVTILTYDSDQEVVKIPDKINEKKVLAIDDSAFYGKQKLKKVIISKYVIRIGHQSFIGCDNLEEVDLPSDILDIGGYAFRVCPKLKNIYVKKGSKTDRSLKETPFYKYVKYKKEK
jgi:hypothetical protein